MKYIVARQYQNRLQKWNNPIYSTCFWMSVIYAGHLPQNHCNITCTYVCISILQDGKLKTYVKSLGKTDFSILFSTIVRSCQMTTALSSYVLFQMVAQTNRKKRSIRLSRPVPSPYNSFRLIPKHAIGTVDFRSFPYLLFGCRHWAWQVQQNNNYGWWVPTSYRPHWPDGCWVLSNKKQVSLLLVGLFHPFITR